MDADELRKIQAPLKDRYRAEPEAARLTLKASGALDSAAIACKVETGRALVAAGLHPATGGSGAELCSGDMLLEALVACAGVTLKAVATSMGMALSAGRVLAEGDLDFRGTLGVAKDAPVGFADIRLTIRTRHGRDAGATRLVAQADGTLLRRAPDTATFAGDRSKARAGLAAEARPPFNLRHGRPSGDGLWGVRKDAIAANRGKQCVCRGGGGLTTTFAPLTCQ